MVANRDGLGQRGGRPGRHGPVDRPLPALDHPPVTSPQAEPRRLPIGHAVALLAGLVLLVAHCPRAPCTAGPDLAETPPAPTPSVSDPGRTPEVPPPAPWTELLAPARWERVPLGERPMGEHVLAVTGRRDEVWVATYGDGVFWRPSGQAPWRHLTRRDGLGSDYLAGVALSDEAVWVRSIGSGLGRRDGRGRWRWWSHRQLGKEFLFPTDLLLHRSRLLVATTDGLRGTDLLGRTWRDTRAADGLPSEYLLSLALSPGRGVWIGYQGGLALSRGARPETVVTPWTGLPGPNVRDVVAAGGLLLVATDSGVGVSRDGGASWASLGPDDGLPSPYVHVLAPGPGAVWAGTARGLAAIDPGRPAVTQVLRNGAAPRRNQINTLYVAPDGRLWAGASDGLWIVTPGEGERPARLEPECRDAGRLRDTEHPAWKRPLAPGANRHLDQTYLFGSTWGGRYPVHQGVELNAPEGTPIRAAAPGLVTFAGVGKHETNGVIVRHDVRYAGLHTYTLYLHLSDVHAVEGRRVGAGDQLGTVGHTGRATNDHLHLGVRLTGEPNNGRGQPSYNPALFLERIPGTGVIAGVVRSRAGERVPGARVYGAVVPAPHETPFAWADTYGAGARSDPVLGEDFVIADVPAGVVPLSVRIDGEEVRRCVRVEEGRLTWVELRPGAPREEPLPADGTRDYTRPGKGGG